MFRILGSPLAEWGIQTTRMSAPDFIDCSNPSPTPGAPHDLERIQGLRSTDKPRGAVRGINNCARILQYARKPCFAPHKRRFAPTRRAWSRGGAGL